MKGVVVTDVHYQNIYHTITSTTQLCNTRLELLMKERIFTWKKNYIHFYMHYKLVV